MLLEPINLNLCDSCTSIQKEHFENYFQIVTLILHRAANKYTLVLVKWY